MRILIQRVFQKDKLLSEDGLSQITFSSCSLEGVLIYMCVTRMNVPVSATSSQIPGFCNLFHFCLSGGGNGISIISMLV
jgi:hypothetical protein